MSIWCGTVERSGKVVDFKTSASFDLEVEMSKHMRSQDEPRSLNPRNPCPVCGAETVLAEVEPHPLHVKFEIHGYVCDRCGPIKSLVVLRSSLRRSMIVSPRPVLLANVPAIRFRAAPARPVESRLRSTRRA